MKQKLKRFIGVCTIIAVVLSGCGVQPRTKDVVADPLPAIGKENVASHHTLVVVSGEPEGIAAAVAAARSGVDTLLLVKEEELGGLYTLGQLNFIDVPETRDGKLLVGGIYKEFADRVGGSAFEIRTAKEVFRDIVAAEPKLSLRTQSQVVHVEQNTDHRTTLRVQDNEGEKTYTADYVIDATPDADVATLAGASSFYGGEDIGLSDNNMGVTLVFRLSGVNWAKVSAYLNAQRAKAEVSGNSGGMGAEGNTAWGFSKEGYAYEPKQDGILLRGMNMARQKNGDVLINALVLFDVDPLDEASREKAKVRALEELESIVPYLAKHCAGFKHAKLAGVADELYVRETRHIRTLKTLTIDDVLENRDQPDKIAVSNYPVDIQATKTLRYGTVVGFPDQYAIGYGSLIPEGIPHMLVVGRAAGYSSLAAGSARIVPTGMACAEAAGTSIALLAEEKLDAKDLWKNQTLLQTLQKRLQDKGARLAHTQTQEEVMAHWAYPGVKTLRALGLMFGGHENDYHLDEKMSQSRYQNLLNGVIKRAGFEMDRYYVNENPPARQIVKTACQALLKSQHKKIDQDTTEAYYRVLREEGVLTPALEPYFQDTEKNPNAAEVVMLLRNLYIWLAQAPGGKTLENVPLQ